MISRAIRIAAYSPKIPKIVAVPNRSSVAKAIPWLITEPEPGMPLNGNTLTYTPLRDLEMFKIMLQLDLDSAKRQIMNGEITKALIERNDASLLPHISPQKNSKDSLSFLIGLTV